MGVFIKYKFRIKTIYRSNSSTTLYHPCKIKFQTLSACYLKASSQLLSPTTLNQYSFFRFYFYFYIYTYYYNIIKLFET